MVCFKCGHEGTGKPLEINSLPSMPPLSMEEFIQAQGHWMTVVLCSGCANGYLTKLDDGERIEAYQYAGKYVLAEM